MHVAAIDLTHASDEVIANFARQQDFVVCTKDADFFRAASVVAGGPSVIWLRIGNSSTDRVVATLWRHAGSLNALAADGRDFSVEIEG